MKSRRPFWTLITYDFNYAFCDFIAHLTLLMRKVLVTRNSTQTTRCSLPGAMDGWAWDYYRSGVSGWRYVNFPSLSAYNVLRLLLLFLHVLSKMTFLTAYRHYTLGMLDFTQTRYINQLTSGSLNRSRYLYDAGIVVSCPTRARLPARNGLVNEVKFLRLITRNG